MKSQDDVFDMYETRMRKVGNFKFHWKRERERERERERKTKRKYHL